jgi:hypothetical protein
VATVDGIQSFLRRIIRALLIACPLSLVAVFSLVWLALGGHPGDAGTYLAAGERLNAGHQLYTLSPGDNLVLLNPPYWTVPLLSPPFIAVAFRPLALLPANTGVYLWWAAMIACTVSAVSLLLVRAPLRTSAAIGILALPVAIQLMVGNLDSALLLGMIGVWWLSQREHQTAAGVIAGFMFIAKLTPFPIVWWLVVTRRWGSVRAAILAVAIGMLISVAGSGPESHFAYLGVVHDTNQIGTTIGSLAGLGRQAGIPAEAARWLPVFGSLLGLGAMALFRQRPRAVWALAVFICVFGSPSVAFHTPALLLAALAPLAWPFGAVTTPTPGSVSSPAFPVSRRVSASVSSP